MKKQEIERIMEALRVLYEKIYELEIRLTKFEREVGTL